MQQLDAQIKAAHEGKKNKMGEVLKTIELGDLLLFAKDCYSFGVYDFDCMAEVLNKNGYMVIKTETLTEVIQAEAFVEKLKHNPYQLNLI